MASDAGPPQATIHPCSVLVLTRNEERDLPGCLASLRWSDDVIVLDSLSTDGTAAIAAAAGARVVARAFDNWASHQNWALANLPFRHPWVFYIDADERVTPELAAAIGRVVRGQGAEVAWMVNRRDFWRGTWLRHVQATAWYARLFRPAAIRYERLVNPVTVIDGPSGRLDGYLDHFPFSKGLDHWLDRHNRYSRLEAEQYLAERGGRGWGSLLGSLLRGDYAGRRRALKGIFNRLPCRPWLRFWILYGLKRGFLDGRAGLDYARLQVIYERMIVMKIREIEDRQAAG